MGVNRGKTAVYSLISIGMPAVPKVLKKISNKDSGQSTIESCVIVLKGILGQKLTRITLEDQLIKVHDPVGKKNLKKAMRVMDVGVPVKMMREGKLVEVIP